MVTWKASASNCWPSMVVASTSTGFSVTLKIAPTTPSAMYFSEIFNNSGFVKPNGTRGLSFGTLRVWTCCISTFIFNFLRPLLGSTSSWTVPSSIILRDAWEVSGSECPLIRHLEGEISTLMSKCDSFSSKRGLDGIWSAMRSSVRSTLIIKAPFVSLGPSIVITFEVVVFNGLVAPKAAEDITKT